MLHPVTIKGMLAAEIILIISNESEEVAVTNARSSRHRRPFILHSPASYARARHDLQARTPRRFRYAGSGITEATDTNQDSPSLED